MHFPRLEESGLPLQSVTSEQWAKEEALEKEMVTSGVEALHRAIDAARAKGQEYNTVYGSRLVSHSLPALTAAIEEEQAKVKTGKAGRLASHVKFLSLLPAEVTAALALVTIMQSISAKTHLNPVALTIGDALEDELRRNSLAEKAPQLYKWAQKRTAKSTHRGYSRKFYHDLASRQAVEVSFTRNDKLHVGLKLIELAAASTGLVSVDKVSQPSKSRIGKPSGKDMGFTYMLSPTPACMDWISRRIEHCEVLSPKYLPTVVPPKRWESPFDGGYWSPGVAGRVLIKTRYHGYLEELAGRVDDMPEVYTAINAIQDTAWKVNLPVLAVAHQLWDDHAGQDSVAGLPPREPLPLPPCPVCGAYLGTASPMDARENHPCFDTCPPETLRTWRIAAGRLYDKQTSLTSKRLQCAKILYLADRYAQESAFWFPHQLDFRGRAYPMPAYLTPQGTDLAKGLLTFAESKPIGKDGWRWLAIHLANCAGEDKISLDDRITWVLKHEQRILSVASSPFGPDFTWWAEADKPFQFLAACFEWAGWKEQGERFKSHLPVAMDGTCNGLQIFSLMLRDETGGKATNLLPSEKPQDIYGIVAEKVTARLKELAENGGLKTKEVKDDDGHTMEKVLYDEKDVASRLLKLGITRKTTKRQVMVVPYGGTLISCREYTLAHLDEQIEADPTLAALFPEQRDSWNAGLFLSGLIWQAIGETVVAARDAMVFLQKLAGLASRKDLPIIWTTPLGFPVLQAYQAYQLRQVKTRLFGGVYKPKIAEDIPELDRQRQRNGVSPNYVHSLDAAAMQHTICICLNEGVTAYSMVHDSYGTHAADAETLARALRFSFVDLFGGKDTNLLAVVRQEVARQTGAKEDDLPDLPPCGTLDVNAVQDSLYFFA